MEIAKLHYISQGKTPKEHIQNIKNVCESGVKWVQLRLKNESPPTILKTTLIAKSICEAYGVKLILNDYLEIAKELDVDGVHLGKEDSCPLLARKLLGPEKIIGGTANTKKDCRDLIDKGVNYIGLGPFRFTETKKSLSPILGIDGYHNIIVALRLKKHNIPIIAIGGILQTDLNLLKETGVYGVAMSGWLTNTANLEEKINTIHARMRKKTPMNYAK
ncbi:thiamine phosphate synthase [Galbibacter sp. PAP.153]|uniref:thiamine phosphate synthase n=1 Tax=Galbibacter sp. PAP.153 TaxID=3104623 RepID=UPI00300B4DED